MSHNRYQPYHTNSPGNPSDDTRDIRIAQVPLHGTGSCNCCNDGEYHHGPDGVTQMVWEFSFGSKHGNMRTIIRMCSRCKAAFKELLVGSPK